MTENLAERLTAILEEYRGRMKTGGHPKELPDRVLALFQNAPADALMPQDLAQLHAAALHYWRLIDDRSASGSEPDPIDLAMVHDELIDALYHYYDLR